jgi:ABC-type uncharacterized transport system involved in gliding motility auxiliary subunit
MKEFVIPRKWITVTGCVGFGLIILTFGVYAATSIFSWYVKILLGIGIAAVLAFWILSAMTSRAARYGSNVAVMILLALCILVLVNFVSARRFSRRLDTTTGKQFSLSEQTKNILKGLDQDISVTAFYTEDHYRRRFAQDILNEYTLQSSKFHLTFIDPNVKPGLAIAYKIERNGTVVFESGGKREDVESYQNEEQDFTSAILKLLATEQKKLYFLSGHDEHDIDGYDDNSYSDLKRIIEADNYRVEKLILGGQIPDDCSILVIAGPKKPLLPHEEEAIARYLDEGGKAIIMVDPPPSPSLANLLGKWGVEVSDDIILDSFLQTIGGDPSVPVTIRYGFHTITVPIARVMTFFPMARSLAPKTDSREDVEVTQLVKASDDSWGELDTESLLSEQRASYDEGRDLKGPMCMAVAVALKEKSEGAEPPLTPGQTPEEAAKEKHVLVAVGDSDFVTNKWLQEGNPDLFMNSVNWLAEEEELVSIRPKDQEQAQVQRLTGRQLRLVTYSSIFAIPILLLIAGGSVWWKRR